MSTPLCTFYYHHRHRRCMSHQPVLLHEVVQALKPRDGAVFVDCTFGGGNYSKALLGTHTRTHAVVGLLLKSDSASPSSPLVASAQNRMHSAPCLP